MDGILVINVSEERQWQSTPWPGPVYSLSEEKEGERKGQREKERERELD